MSDWLLYFWKCVCAVWRCMCVVHWGWFFELLQLCVWLLLGGGCHLFLCEQLFLHPLLRRERMQSVCL